MEIQPAFPPHRRQDPRRRAEAIVYDQLARSGLPGHALYELKALPEAPELDFFAWFEDRARFGAQVKGGMYSVNRTVWTLQTVNGTEYVPCPLTQTGTPPSPSGMRCTASWASRSSSSRCSSSPTPLRTSLIEE